MTVQATSDKAKLFLLDADTALRRLQRLYVAKDARGARQVNDFHLNYRNALLTLLGQIALFPDVHSSLHSSLLRVAREEGSLEGLEPVLLTLLNAAGASSDHQRFQEALSLWTDIGAKTSTSLPSPNSNSILFYNVTNKAMTVLTLDGLDSIRPGGAQFQTLKSPSALGRYIERYVGSVIISNVFGGQNPFDALPNDVKDDIKGIQDTATTVAAALTTALALGLISGLVGPIVVAVIFVANAIVDGIQDANQVANDLSSARTFSVKIPPPPVPDPAPDPVPDPAPDPAPDPVPDPAPDPAPDPVPDGGDGNGNGSGGGNGDGGDGSGGGNGDGGDGPVLGLTYEPAKMLEK
jgi:uncharacterized membrane protein YgcG